jgi:hypothetical protein
MTDEQLQQVTAYVQQVIPMFHLGSFDITVSKDPCANDDSDAEVWRTRKQNDGEIHINGLFWTRTALQQRETIAHELIHVAHTHVDRIIESDLIGSNILGKPLETMISQFYDREMDAFVQHMARIVAPFMPVLPWKGEGAKP